MKFPLRFEASTSRAEFVRLLSAATAEDSLTETPDGFAGRGWRLSLSPMEALVIGSVRLERHRVELEFDGLSNAEQEAFMDRFARYYQRGGG